MPIKSHRHPQPRWTCQHYIIWHDFWRYYRYYTKIFWIVLCRFRSTAISHRTETSSFLRSSLRESIQKLHRKKDVSIRERGYQRHQSVIYIYIFEFWFQKISLLLTLAFWFKLVWMFSCSKKLLFFWNKYYFLKTRRLEYLAFSQIGRRICWVANFIVSHGSKAGKLSQSFLFLQFKKSRLRTETSLAKRNLTRNRRWLWKNSSCLQCMLAWGECTSWFPFISSTRRLCI